jgi:hypothetical protein
MFGAAKFFRSDNVATNENGMVFDFYYDWRTDLTVGFELLTIEPA